MTFTKNDYNDDNDMIWYSVENYILNFKGKSPNKYVQFGKFFIRI